MKFTIFLSLLSLGAASYCPSIPATPIEQTQILDEFISKFYIQKNVTKAFSDHFSPAVIEHDPDSPGNGWTPDSLGPLQNLISSSNLTMMHWGVADNIGYVHIRQDTEGQLPEGLVDIVRFDVGGSCIVEHWDVQQTRLPNATNPNAMW